MLQEVKPIFGGANREAEESKSRILNSADREYDGGKTYYFSQYGDNFSNGNSSEIKKFSLEAIEKLEINPGDSVLFERGSVFRLEGMLWLKPGVHYGAFGYGNKPSFFGSLKNYADETFWDKTNVDFVWKTELKGEQRASLISFDDDTFLGNWCFTFEEMSQDGDFYHDYANGVLYLKLSSGNPGNVFKKIEIATTGIAFRASFIDGMSIDNIEFKYFTQGAFLLGECNDITITDCVMGWQGGKIFEMRDNKPLRYGNAAEFWYQCRNITVENCYIYQIFDAALTFQGFGDGGPIFENIIFKNNLIEYCSMNIEYWAGNANDTIPPRIKNIVYYGNIIRFCGYGWGGIQRFDKEDQALLLGWNRKYQDISDFIIENNILDCSNGFYIYMLGPNEQSGITLKANSYYQKLPTEKAEFTHIIKGKDTIATNEKEFKDYILLFDENPKLIKWIY